MSMEAADWHKPGMQSTEVAVVGGGPAGAICALILACEGVSVSLIHWDGYAPGGVELVSGHARRMIEHYCPDLFLRIPGVEIQDTVSLWGTPDPVNFNVMFNPWGAGIALERSLLDRALRDLAQNAGVSVMPDTKVANIERGEGGWQLLLRQGKNGSGLVSTPFLVVATGRVAGGLLARPPVTESSRIALMAPLPASLATANGPGHTLYLEAVKNGWWYALPTADGGHFAGLCTDRDELKKRHATLREFFIQELQRTRLLAPLLSNTPVDLRISGRIAGARAFSRAAGDGWIAVGDAAYAPDPLSGMGLELAIESAQLGAEALLQAVREPALNKFAEYEDVMRGRASRHGEIAGRFYSQV